MGKAAMCGMIGALSITIGTIVIPSENFVRLRANEAERSAVLAVTLEYEAPNMDANQADVVPSVDVNQTNTCPHTDGNHTSDCPYWDGSQTNTCPHTDGNHTQDCPYWDGNGNGAGNGGHHGGGHHGGGHHGR